jgi:hypothetical protein
MKKRKVRKITRKKPSKILSKSRSRKNRPRKTKRRKTTKQHSRKKTRKPRNTTKKRMRDSIDKGGSTNNKLVERSKSSSQIKSPSQIKSLSEIKSLYTSVKEILDLKSCENCSELNEQLELLANELNKDIEGEAPDILLRDSSFVGKIAKFNKLLDVTDIEKEITRLKNSIVSLVDSEHSFKIDYLFNYINNNNSTHTPENLQDLNYILKTHGYYRKQRTGLEYILEMMRKKLETLSNPVNRDRLVSECDKYNERYLPLIRGIMIKYNKELKDKNWKNELKQNRADLAFFQNNKECLPCITSINKLLTHQLSILNP